MKKVHHIIHLIVCSGICLIFGSAGWALEMSETYQPGIGKVIGHIAEVEGDVILQHADSNTGYKAATNLPLYQKDIIVTEKNGRANIAFVDGSAMQLASSTKIVLNRNIFNPRTKTRSSFLDMSIGKARFLIVKFLNFREASFKVRTPTAVAGVRGSDFVIDATSELTVIAAFEDTTLGVISTAQPDAEPVMIRNFKRISVVKGEPPSEQEWISAEEVEEMTREFLGTIETTSAADAIDRKTTKAAKPILLKKDAVERIGITEENLLSDQDQDIDDLAQTNEFERQMEDSDTLVGEIIQERTLDNIMAPEFPSARPDQSQ